MCMSVWGVRARTAQKRQGMRVVFIQVSTTCYGCVCVCLCVYMFSSVCTFVCDMRYIQTGHQKWAQNLDMIVKIFPKKFVKQLIVLLLCFLGLVYKIHKQMMLLLLLLHTFFSSLMQHARNCTHSKKYIESLLLLMIIIVAPSTTVYL